MKKHMSAVVPQSAGVGSNAWWNDHSNTGPGCNNRSEQEPILVTVPSSGADSNACNLRSEIASLLGGVLNDGSDSGVGSGASGDVSKLEGSQSSTGDGALMTVPSSGGGSNDCNFRSGIARLFGGVLDDGSDSGVGSGASGDVSKLEGSQSSTGDGALMTVPSLGGPFTQRPTTGQRMFQDSERVAAALSNTESVDRKQDGRELGANNEEVKGVKEVDVTAPPAPASR